MVREARDALLHRLGAAFANLLPHQYNRPPGERPGAGVNSPPGRTWSGASVAKILKKEEIAPRFWRFEVEAPEIARKHKAGQFVMIMVSEHGERIPLTIAGTDVANGSITLVVQEVGKTTMEMGLLAEGQELYTVIGPLGTPTHIERFGTVICVGGGAGIAPLLPIATAMKKAGNTVRTILGGRTKDLVILRDEMAAVADEIVYTTDDGSFGRKGFVTHALTDMIGERGRPDLVVAIGPAIMMKVVADLTRKDGIPTLCSLNSIMIDGTGMCGGCRVDVGGTSKFVCVDGPEFDAHKVDFDLLIKRLRTYLPQEEEALARFLATHACKAVEEANHA